MMMPMCSLKLLLISILSPQRFTYSTKNQNGYSVFGRVHTETTFFVASSALT